MGLGRSGVHGLRRLGTVERRNGDLVVDPDLNDKE
jgi:hypothetical protein